STSTRALASRGPTATSATPITLRTRSGTHTHSTVSQIGLRPSFGFRGPIVTGQVESSRSGVRVEDVVETRRDEVRSAEPRKRGEVIELHRSMGDGVANDPKR